jgi:uncharacterized membrane protein YkoI
MKTKHSLMTPMLNLALMLEAGASLADEDTQQAARLIRAGDILPFGAIVRRGNLVRLCRVVTEMDLDDETGLFNYEVGIVDPQSIEWDFDFDAKIGAALGYRRGD